MLYVVDMWINVPISQFLEWSELFQNIFCSNKLPKKKRLHTWNLVSKNFSWLMLTLARLLYDSLNTSSLRKSPASPTTFQQETNNMVMDECWFWICHSQIIFYYLCNQLMDTVLKNYVHNIPLEHNPLLIVTCVISVRYSYMSCTLASPKLLNSGKNSSLIWSQKKKKKIITGIA